jgi:adenylate cyclase
MSAESFKRKLTAILSADVKGYSRLMGENEAETVKTLTSYRKIMSELIQQHRGRVIDSPGDNILAEFGSVVDAVQCSVAAQNEFKARNAELPENRRMQFRIGVNLGDVIEEENRIYGDGVNIAARLEALADPGGICISKTAFDHIESKLPLGYQFLGEQTVKNIAKPVGAYKVLMEPRVLPVEEKKKARKVTFWHRKPVLAGAVVVLIVLIGTAVWNFYLRAPKLERASKEKMAFPLPDKPSIAVLPFANMSEDPKQEYFSDGLSEEIITALSKVPKLFVIARNSTFSYKGKSVKVNQVAEELGVRYVLEGSVRKEGDRVRITAQLIDALSGHHLWAERYDRELKDIFALQDEITMKIMIAMQVKLTEGEQARLYGKGTKKLEAYLKILQGRQYLESLNRANLALAQQVLGEAIALDPGYAEAYTHLAATHFLAASFVDSKSPGKSLANARELAKKAVLLDDSDANPHSILGLVLAAGGEHEQGVAEGERAVTLNPNSADAYARLGVALSFSQRWKEAIASFQQAIRLNPIPPVFYLFSMGLAYSNAERDEEAIAVGKKGVEREPDNLLAWSFLAATYASAGRAEEAQSAVKEILRINPQSCIGDMYRRYFKRPGLLEALRKAGLPDCPPRPSS